MSEDDVGEFVPARMLPGPGSPAPANCASNVLCCSVGPSSSRRVRSKIKLLESAEIQPGCSVRGYSFISVGHRKSKHVDANVARERVEVGR